MGKRAVVVHRLIMVDAVRSVFLTAQCPGNVVAFLGMTYNRTKRPVQRQDLSHFYCSQILETSDTFISMEQTTELCSVSRWEPSLP